MARNKLITIRIEGEKREAFNNLAKSHNTDTASLLYDFISGCLDGRIDIKLVTGKKQWIDKIDNQLDSERIDKLETATQEIGERLDNWIWVSERSLENNLNSLRDQVNALAIQLNRQQIDRIDTDSQQDSQKENPDMEPTGETSPLPPDEPGDGGNANTPEVSPSPPSPALEAIEDSEKKIIPLPDILIGSPIGIDESGSESISSINEPVKGAIETLTPEVSPSPPLPLDAIETVTGDSDSIDTEPGEVVTKTDSKPWYTIDDLLDCRYPGWPKTKEGLRKKAKREHWPKRTRRGSKGNPYEYQAVLPE